jgi:hypothetical protein
MFGRSARPSRITIGVTFVLFRQAQIKISGFSCLYHVLVSISYSRVYITFYCLYHVLASISRSAQRQNRYITIFINVPGSESMITRKRQLTAFTDETQYTCIIDIKCITVFKRKLTNKMYTILWISEEVRLLCNKVFAPHTFEGRFKGRICPQNRRLLLPECNSLKATFLMTTQRDGTTSHSGERS